MRRELLQVQTVLKKSESDRLEADAERERADVARRAAETRLSVEIEARVAAESQLSSVRSTVEQQNSELDRRLARIRELELRVEGLESNVLELAALRARNAELEALERQANQSPAVPAPGPGSSLPLELDDLQRIRGIGPAFARALRARGVLTFRQVAAWTEADIAEVAKALRVQVARIQRDDWVGNAKALISSSPSSE